MSKWKELRDSPLFIVVGAIVATVGITATVYEKLLVPMRDPDGVRALQEMQGRLDAARQALAGRADAQAALTEALERSHKEGREHASTLEALRSKLAEAQAKVASLQNVNTFAPGEPYPVTLGRLRVGDPVSRAGEVYGSENVDDDKEGIVRIKTGHATFKQINAYYDERGKDRRITHLVFVSDERAPNAREWIVDRLRQALGEPTRQVRRRNSTYYRWDRKGRESVFVSDLGFIVMSGGASPIWWPRDG